MDFTSYHEERQISEVVEQGERQMEDMVHKLSLAGGAKAKVPTGTEAEAESESEKEKGKELKAEASSLSPAIRE